MARQVRENVGLDEFTPPKFFHLRIVRLGLAQVIIGLITVAVGVMDIAFSSVAFDIFPMAQVATGVWVGAVITLTGVVGVSQSRSDLRRKALSFAFLVLSLLSWLLSIVMIGIAIAEIAQSEFAEGQLKTQEKLPINGTQCFNVTTGSQPIVRCVATATFDQKLVSDSLLVALGYIESMNAIYSFFVSFGIVRSFVDSQHTQSMGMRERVNVPNMSVDAYFEQQMQHDEEHHRNNHVSIDGNASSRRSRIPGIDSTPSLHQSPSMGDFPDSEQFRSHLEGV